MNVFLFVLVKEHSRLFSCGAMRMSSIVVPKPVLYLVIQLVDGDRRMEHESLAEELTDSFHVTLDLTFVLG